jgi:hypothetical protein
MLVGFIFFNLKYLSQATTWHVGQTINPLTREQCLRNAYKKRCTDTAGNAS